MLLNLRLIFLFSLVLFCFSFIYNEPIPEPSIFGKKFIETIKQNNESVYIQTFSLTRQEWEAYFIKSRQNAYLSEEQKLKINQQKLEYTISEWDVNLKRNFNRIQTWIVNDTIDISKIKYIDIDYVLLFNKKYSPSYHLVDIYILIKHDSQLFKIRFFNVNYINNKWVCGMISSITKVDAYLQEIKEAEPPRDHPIEYDTSSVIVNENDSLYFPPHSNHKKLSKNDSLKVLKLQNKIEGIYKK